MKLLSTADDSLAEDESIPTFWYADYSYYLTEVLVESRTKHSYLEWLNDNSTLNRKFIKPN